MMDYEVYRPTDGGRFPRAVSKVQPMTEWDPSKVRIIEAYDINWDAIMRRFDYLGPDGRQHHVSQFVSPGLDKYVARLGVKKRARVKRLFRKSTLTLDEMVELLHDHWSKTYA